MARSTILIDRENARTHNIRFGNMAGRRIYPHRSVRLSSAVQAEQLLSSASFPAESHRIARVWHGLCGSLANIIIQYTIPQCPQSAIAQSHWSDTGRSYTNEVYAVNCFSLFPSKLFYLLVLPAQVFRFNLRYAKSSIELFF